MNRLAEIVLGDGILHRCRFSGSEVPAFGTVCVVTIDGVSEFGSFVGILDFSCGGTASYPASFEHVANEEELLRLTGNAEALARARGVLLKWASEGRRAVYALRMRFTVRRERLYLTLDAVDVPSFQPIFETLEKRFQTHVSAQFVSSRALSAVIGGMGVCGCVLCCTNGTCEQSRVEVKMAKQQLVPLHDAVAVGLCGRLKCCIAYEV